MRQFAYDEMHSKVLHSARSRGSRRLDEPTGEALSLRGRVPKMGDRVTTGSKSSDLKERKDFIEQRKKRKARKARKAQEATSSASSATVTTPLTGLSYMPTTASTGAALEEFLAKIHKCLGDIPTDILYGATGEALAILKSDKFISGRRSHLDELLGPVDDATFSKLTSIAMRITDYVEDEDTGYGSTPMASAQSNDDDDDELILAGDDIDEDGSDSSDDGDWARQEVVSGSGSDSGDDVDMAAPSSHGLSSSTSRGAESKEESGAHAKGDVLSAADIDAHWIQREVSRYIKDPNEAQEVADGVLQILVENIHDDRTLENELVMLLDIDKFDLIKTLMDNKATIMYSVRYKQAGDATERAQVEAEMAKDVSNGGTKVLEQLREKRSVSSWSKDREASVVAKALQDAEHAGITTEGTAMVQGQSFSQRPRETVNLDDLIFAEGARLMTNRKCKLPEGSQRRQLRGYEEVHIPPSTRGAPGGLQGSENLVDIAEMPEWARHAFQGMQRLNAMQSKVYDAALLGPENMLLCAPTGAGKTNVACLTMLHEIGLHILGKNSEQSGTNAGTVSVDLSAFKMVYIAPMKALVKEVVMNFGKRLRPYGLSVRELSGDQGLSRQELADTQLIVTTPEKWDVVTRKGAGGSSTNAFTQLVRLVIIDEIHLLHDERGAVLETIIARTLRQVEATQDMVRVIGLSATLPNYQDVATFLRVKPSLCFYFDGTYRPVPLEQEYVGVMEKKPHKRLQMMNDITYEKVMAQDDGDQALVFVHSRKETAKTARQLRDMAMEKGDL